MCPTVEMKHIRIPPLGRESILTFEFILLFHFSVFQSLQFLHLYRTVWWLPQSFTSSGMVSDFYEDFFVKLLSMKYHVWLHIWLKICFQNFYLIDVNLMIFNLLLIGRRIPYLILKRILPRCSHFMLRATMSASVCIGVLLNTVHIWNNHNYKNGSFGVLHLLYLFGPYVVLLANCCSRICRSFFSLFPFTFNKLL